MHARRARRRPLPAISPDAPFMANLAWGASRTSGAMLAWLFSGMFQRFPNLKIALSEGEIGWIPYFLERAEQVLDKQRYWVQRGVQFTGHATTDVDLDTIERPGAVPRSRLRVLHRRRPRNREHRRDRRGQHHVRDRLPALGLDLARLHRCRAATHQGPSRGAAVQGPARQRRAAVPVHAGEPPVPRMPEARRRSWSTATVHGERHVHRVRAARSRTTTRPRRWSSTRG